VTTVHLIILYANTIEPFADTSTSAADDITKLMTSASEVFCPAIDAILDDMQTKYSGTDEQKRDEAKLELLKEAKGAMFPCPAPSDPLATPADIDNRILLSTQFLQSKLISLKEQIQTSLDCPKKEGFQSAYEEGFNVCSGEEEIKKEDLQRKEAALAATKSCVSPKGLSEEDKNKILQARLAAISRVMGNPIMPPKFAAIKSLTVEIKELKAKAEKGELKSNCPS
jgi:flagellar biosynthesis/type III secretory pathway protein FliH